MSHDLLILQSINNSGEHVPETSHAVMEQQEMFMVDFQNDNDADLIFVPPESEID